MTRLELALLWQKILQRNPPELFGSNFHLLKSRHEGDLIPQPGYVGRNYTTGGILFISMNPGGGKDGQSDRDKKQYAALKDLRDSNLVTAEATFDALTDVLAEIMPQFKIIRNFVTPILVGSQLSFSNISYLNLLKWRSEKSSNLKKLYELSWHDHTAEQIRLLAPRHIIAIGKDAGNSLSALSSKTVLSIPRVIGNNIDDKGREAILEAMLLIKQ